MKKGLILTLVLCLLAACGGEPTPTPDLVATQIAVEDAAHATMTARIPTATSTPEPTPVPTSTPTPTITPTPGPTLTPPPNIEAEEYAVISAVIQQNPIGYDLGSSLVIREQTVAGLDMLDMFERSMEEDDPLAELADSYRSRNAESYTLSASLDLEQDYTLMTEDEFDEIFRGEGPIWPKIEAKYPDSRGVLIVSRVGFNADADQALVDLGFRCGDLCGAGGLYLLVKEGGSWKFEKSLMEWMS